MFYCSDNGSTKWQDINVHYEDVLLILTWKVCKDKWRQISKLIIVKEGKLDTLQNITQWKYINIVVQVKIEEYRCKVNILGHKGYLRNLFFKSLAISDWNMKDIYVLNIH